jgi:hypothetical protein
VIVFGEMALGALLLLIGIGGALARRPTLARIRVPVDRRR